MCTAHGCRPVGEECRLVEGRCGGAGGEVHDLHQGVDRVLVVGAGISDHRGGPLHVHGVDEAGSTAAG